MKLKYMYTAHIRPRKSLCCPFLTDPKNEIYGHNLDSNRFPSHVFVWKILVLLFIVSF